MQNTQNNACSVVGTMQDLSATNHSNNFLIAKENPSYVKLVQAILPGMLHWVFFVFYDIHISEEYRPYLAESLLIWGILMFFYS